MTGGQGGGWEMRKTERRKCLLHPLRGASFSLGQAFPLGQACSLHSSLDLDPFMRGGLNMSAYVGGRETQQKDGHSPVRHRYDLHTSRSCCCACLKLRESHRNVCVLLSFLSSACFTCLSKSKIHNNSAVCSGPLFSTLAAPYDGL